MQTSLARQWNLKWCSSSQLYFFYLVQHSCASLLYIQGKYSLELKNEKYKAFANNTNLNDLSILQQTLWNKEEIDKFNGSEAPLLLCCSPNCWNRFGWPRKTHSAWDILLATWSWCCLSHLDFGISIGKFRYVCILYVMKCIMECDLYINCKLQTEQLQCWDSGATWSYWATPPGDCRSWVGTGAGGSPASRPPPRPG